jgi:tetraacyldisaccharide 4'-kinase
MKIVDLRPFWVRSFSRPDATPSPPRGLARLAGRIADGIMATRVSRRPPIGAGPLLVSVGNLALGGTGKTPVVLSLARELAAGGISGAVLTRGYGSTLAGPLSVQAGNTLAGDEARMMASTLGDSGWPVIQSRNRPKGLEYLQAQPEKYQIILLEDAHQTRGLARHVDLVILDSWNHRQENGKTLLEPVTGPVFPFGPWRESAAGADRAAAFLIEGEDLPAAEGPSGQPVFAFWRKMNLRQVHGGGISRDQSSWGLLSGIARPHRFEKTATGHVSGPVVFSLRCPDHVGYSSPLVEKVVKAMDRHGADGLVTTAKDWVKLSDLWTDNRPVFVLELEVAWRNENALKQFLLERVQNIDESLGQSGFTTP